MSSLALRMRSVDGKFSVSSFQLSVQNMAVTRKSELHQRRLLARTIACVSPVIAIAALYGGLPTAVAQTSSFVILNALLVDGTGAPPRAGGLRVVNGRIADVGDVKPAAGEQAIDAHGLALAPGSSIRTTTRPTAC